ncbi:MAG: DUF4249 domain-containing protein [Agriterribacter sp.]
MKPIYCFLCLLVLMWVAGCKEKFALPETVINKNYLVVEGFIDGGNDSTFIHLSRTVIPDDTTRIKAETGARVIIQGENGESYYLTEISDGNYAIPPLALNPSEKYRVSITTSNSKVYLSDYVEIKRTPAIDSISWVRESNGVQIYANTHDAENNTKYYQWEYKETWEFHSAYLSSWEFVPADSSMIHRQHPELIYRCWQSYTSSNILVGSSAKLSEDIIYNFPLTFIPDDSWKLQSRYSINVTQRALNKGAYEYLENMKKNSEQLGSIFDPQPSTTNGNIHCTTDANEPVIGYIYSSTLLQQRIFIDRADLDSWNYRFFCEEISVKNDKDSLGQAFAGAGYIPTSEEGSGPFIARFKGSSATCVDCTLRGTNVKPDFW